MMGLLAFTSVKAEDFPYENYYYQLYYHCGFINEKLAHANVQVSNDNANFYATLEGSSIPIGGRLYCINDTLQSTFEITATPTQPGSETIELIAGYYRKPKVGEELYSPSAHTYRSIDGQGFLSADPATIECVTLTADMLAMFYYAKSIDFANMEQGSTIDIPILLADGSQRTLTLTYNGESTFHGHDTYLLTANFTYHGTESKYPITIHIDKDELVPLNFAASIVIGDVSLRLEQ